MTPATSSDEDAFEAAIKAFADQFGGTERSGEAPAIKQMADEATAIATSARHLPEEDVTRDEGDGADQDKA